MCLDIDSLIRNSDIFSSLTPEDLKIILSISEVSELQDKHMLFQSGDPSTCFYMVLEGQVIIRTDNADAHQTDIARFLSGDSFGEVDFLMAKPRSAMGIAVGTTKLLKFPENKMTLSDISEQWPSTSARLMHSFLADISTRIRNANTLIKNNSPLVRELKRQVYIDKLTGLNNKTCFDEAMTRTLKEHPSIGLLIYKPDNFKGINDTYGHEAGDQVLKYIAESLAKIVPNQDMLFRYMGNENAVILPMGTRESLRQLGDSIMNLLNNLDLSEVIDDIDDRISVSMGLALSPHHGQSPEALVKTAHGLTMEGRRRGGNLILFPEDSDET